MLMQPLPVSQGISRPFVVGLVMLLLFLSIQTDWGAVKQQGGGRRADLRQLGFAASPESAELPSTREKIIYELSMSNDKLERENWQMRQHILDLRRGMRKEGCELNGTLYTFPDVEKWLQTANNTQRAKFDRHRPRRHGIADIKLQPQEVEEQHEDQNQKGGSSHHLRGVGDQAKGPPRLARLK